MKGYWSLWVDVPRNPQKQYYSLLLLAYILRTQACLSPKTLAAALHPEFANPRDLKPKPRNLKLHVCCP